MPTRPVAPAAARKSARRFSIRIFESLTVANYRRYAVGQLVSHTGTWMQRAAQAWLVLVVTGNAAAVGFATALQTTPLLLFGLWGGVIADRFPKRRLIMASQAVMGLQGLVLGLLVLSGRVQVWHVYALAFALGVAAAVDSPARQSFVVEMVGKDHIGNAVALNAVTMNMSRLLGPAVAGFLIASIGTGQVFLVNAASYVVVIVCLLLMRTDELRPTDRSVGGQRKLRDGLHQVRMRPAVLLSLVMLGTAATFGQNFQVTIVLMATNVYGVNAASYGVLFSALGVGAVLGSLLAARRRTHGVYLVVTATAGFGLCVMLGGLAPTYWAYMLTLVPTGLIWLTVTTTSNTLVQLGVPAPYLGRVMAVYMLAHQGGAPIGGTVSGVLAEWLGPRASVVICGLVPFVAAIVGGVTYHLASRRSGAAAMGQ